MAKEKKLVEEITARDVDFAQWYTDVVKKAELMSYSQIKGFMNYLPAGYAIWENMQREMDAMFKENGVENCYLPVLIPENLLKKEGDLVEGFAPEVAWVTQGGSSPLEERLAVRPTSETMFSELYRTIVHSYRDLPKKYNQWCSVVRWEKTTRPFLRSSEFLWQEGHSAFATEEESEEFTQRMLNVYADFCEQVLAIPVVKGRKTDSEKFAGASSTYTIETLMHDGKALQSGTSHNFGDGFAKAYGIQYTDKDNKLQYAHQNSFGASTRLIGAVIMVHGDDSGLVLPPRIAPTQVMIVPIRQTAEGVLEAAHGLQEVLKKAGVRVKLDDSEKSPGWKFADAEMRGIPLRIEIGPKDLENGKCVIVHLDNREKTECAIADVVSTVQDLLVTEQADMLVRATDFLNSHFSEAHTYDEFRDCVNNRPGFIKAMWCGDPACEARIKEDTTATSRCMPFDQMPIDDKCVCCGKPATKLVYWGKAY